MFADLPLALAMHDPASRAAVLDTLDAVASEVERSGEPYDGPVTLALGAMAHCPHSIEHAAFLRLSHLSRESFCN